jgi:hypothetical protein
MNHYDAADPLTVLRADDLPVQPDPVFAARLRTRLEAALSLPPNTGQVRASGIRLRYPLRNGRAVPMAWGARTVKLRTVVAVALGIVLLLGIGGVWSLGHGTFSDLTRDRGVNDFSASTSERPAGQDAISGRGAVTDGPVMKAMPPQRVPAPADQSATTPQGGTPAPAAPPQVPPSATVAPDIVTTGSVQMFAAEPSQVADRLVAAVKDAGGRVDEDSRSERSGSSSPTAALVLRIPSDKVDAVLADAKKLGTVESMSIEHNDVTLQRVDLDARIEALQTSVNRLLELMGRADNTADLLAAESSLTQRQADLDSLRAQRTELRDQIAYAKINVNLSAEPVQPTVPRGGFLGALARGWHSLISTAQGVVAAAGFLLPWVPVLAVLALVIGFVVRRRRKARQPVGQVDPAPGSTSATEAGHP